MLEAYIQSTRKVKGERNAQLNDYYHEVFATIKKHAPFDLSDVNLEVVYSSNKTAEMLHYNGQHYLIYDQYLGQVFNMMNRLFFNSTVPRETFAYSLKIFAEEIQLEGRPDVALISALSYLKVIDESSTYKNDIDFAKRVNYTAIQETFVMVHELMHFSEIADADYIKNARAEVINLLDHQLSLLDNEELQNNITFSYLADHYKLMYGDEPFTKDKLPEGYFEKIRDDYIQTEKESKRLMMQLIEESDEFIEEMICDEQAADLTMWIMLQEHQFHPEMTYDGIYLAMLHLRILGMLNAEAKYFTSNEEQDKADLSKFLVTSDLRCRKVRDEITVIYGLKLKDDSKSELMHKLLTRTNEQYHSIILDPVLFMTLDRIGVIKEKAATFDLDFNKLMNDSEQTDWVLGPKGTIFPKPN